MSLLIKTTNLRKTFVQVNQPYTILENINLEIQEGDTIVIWGASGSGKTTLLHLLSGLLTPDGGTIEYFSPQHDFLANIPPFSEQERDSLAFSSLPLRICWVPQSPLLLDVLPVHENLFFLSDLFGVPREVSEPVIAEFIELLELTPLLFSYPPMLSEGEKKRVSFIQAMAAYPHVLFLDEPSAGLDDVTKEKVLSILFSNPLFRKTTKVIATHDPRFQKVAGQHYQISNTTLKKVDYESNK